MPGHNTITVQFDWIGRCAETDRISCGEGETDGGVDEED